MSDETGPPDPKLSGREDAETLMARIDGRMDDIANRFDRTDWVELLAVIILALATITATWSAYQSSRWGGEQAAAMSQAGALRISAGQAISVAGAQVELDSQLSVAWLLRAVDGDENGMAVFEERIREEMKPAFDAWLALVPPGEIPPGMPMDLPEYEELAGEAADFAVELNTRANDAAERGADANQTSDDFVLIAVLMASVMFFAGVGTRFKSRRVRVAMVTLAVVAFVGGFAFMLSLPQNLGL
ncbi:MAG: hypothetical protein ACC726_11335 [Chloroflexota bacterium]